MGVAVSHLWYNISKGFTMIPFARTRYGKMHYMYASQRGSSKKRGMIMPNYTKAEFMEWLEIQPFFDILFDRWTESNYNRMEAPSADRLDDSKPYTISNLKLMSFRENNAKSHEDRKSGKLITSQNRIVEQLSRAGDVINKFYSINEAGRSIGAKSFSKITEVCKGKRKTAYNFKWRYADESQEV